MGFFDSIGNTLRANFNPEFLTSDATANIDVNASKKSVSSQYSPTTTTTTTINPVDARQLVINLNSPGTTTKKADRISGSDVSPSVTSSPNQSTDLGATEVPLDIGLPSIGGSGVIQWLVIVGIGFGAYKLLSSKDNGRKA